MGNNTLLPNLENTVAAVLEEYPAGVYLAAVSGGADSTAMLAALAAVRDRAVHGTAFAFNLHCVHVEHGIRPEAESRGDAAFVRSLCEKLQVPCRVVSIAPGKIAAAAKERGMGIEAAARHYRHRAWFREAARLEAESGESAAGATMPVRVLTAHTADDMRETVLMRLLRGVGPSGLAAMPVSRGRILRPLISLSRRDVLNYLNEKNISWREDSTNADTQFLRNRVRRCLIPLLEESFPQWRGGIAALGETQSLIADFMQDEAALRVQWQPAPQSLYTNAETFFAQPPIIREEALFQGLDKLLPAAHASHTIKRKNIRRFCAGGITAIDLGPLRLKKDSYRITISIFSDPRSRIRPFAVD
jgi:tRNA(Ile)-lysidine synthase